MLLDHGLYRRLSEDYRLAYAQLWCALLAQDDAAGRAAASALGAPSAETQPRLTGEGAGVGPR